MLFSNNVRSGGANKLDGFSQKLFWVCIKYDTPSTITSIVPVTC